MKSNKQLFLIFLLLVGITAIYKAIPYEMRPEWLGGPQLAMALFAGAVIKKREWAFLLPLMSLFIADAVMQGLFAAGFTAYPGFYSGQMLNYAFIGLLVVVGFFVNKSKVSSILAGLIGAPTVYFLLSNFAVWVSGGGLHRPKTIGGMIQCYSDAVPFYGGSLVSALIYGTILFGSYHLYTKRAPELQKIA